MVHQILLCLISVKFVFAVAVFVYVFYLASKNKSINIPEKKIFPKLF